MSGLIDIHHHHVPPRLAAAFPNSLPPPVRNWSPAASLAAMDDAEVTSAVLVLAQMGGPESLALWDAALVRACNEYAAELKRRYPERFSFFAWLPLPDTEASLTELAYALDVLGASGIGFFTSYGLSWPGDPRFAPVFDELNRRGAVAYFHPHAPSCCANLLPGVLDNYVEYPQDTARAAMSLLFGGTLARNRNIRWIFSHAGGPIPIYAQRVATLCAGRADTVNVAPDGIVAELRRLYFETANAAYGPAMAALLAFVDSSQVFFGTDYPFVSVAANAEAFRALAMDDDIRAAIAYQNAERVIPLLPIRHQTAPR
jgi:predicted TIM-barrel fold metal-dependent hydrolase